MLYFPTLQTHYGDVAATCRTRGTVLQWREIITLHTDDECKFNQLSYLPGNYLDNCRAKGCLCVCLGKFWPRPCALLYSR